MFAFFVRSRYWPIIKCAGALRTDLVSLFIQKFGKKENFCLWLIGFSGRQIGVHAVLWEKITTALQQSMQTGIIHRWCFSTNDMELHSRQRQRKKLKANFDLIFYLNRNRDQKHQLDSDKHDETATTTMTKKFSITTNDRKTANAKRKRTITQMDCIFMHFLEIEKLNDNNYKLYFILYKIRYFVCVFFFCFCASVAWQKNVYETCIVNNKTV